MQYTDRFGSPLNVGDRVVIALSAGRGSAEMKEVTVAGIVPLLPHRDKTEPKRRYDRQAGNYAGEILGFYYMREDQQAQRHATSFYRDKDTPQDKLYVLQYWQEARWDSPSRGVKKGDLTKRQSFDRVMDVVKVPA